MREKMKDMGDRRMQTRIAHMPKILALVLLSGLLIYLVGCQSEDSNNEEGSSDGDRLSVSIMTTAHTPEPPSEDSPALKALEDYTDTNIDMIYVPNSDYDDRFNITLGSGDLPTIMLTDKTPSFIQAVRDGAFWDLTDYIDDYENLGELNDIVRNNVSIDGGIYGLPRTRPLGRHAVTIRKDWLDNLGLDMPETIDEFYEVMKAFTYDDPNQSGEDDTVGLVVSEYEGPWDTMQTWFGVPNEWGVDEDGTLYPHFEAPEYREALDFFKKLYDEGLVNEDFAVKDPSKWHDEFINGNAGMVVDVADAANRNFKKMKKDDDSLDDDAVDLFPAVEGPNGLYNLPSSGYNLMLAISKTDVETEDELRDVLEFMDKLSTEEGQTLAHNGLEGVHYEIEDGNYVPTEDQKLVYEYQDLNQILTFIPEDRFLKEPETPLKEKEYEVIDENEEIVVENPSEALISEVYSKKGAQLDDIINDARIKYIVGQIDEEGLDEAEELWLRSGGQDLIDEMNDLYKDIQ